MYPSKTYTEPYKKLMFMVRFASLADVTQTPRPVSKRERERERDFGFVRSALL